MNAYSVAARAVGALIGVVAVVVFAACAPDDGVPPRPAGQSAERPGGY